MDNNASAPRKRATDSAVRRFRFPSWSPSIVSTLCGCISAVGYTAANCCLRAVKDVDPIWVSWNKAVPTAVVCGAVLAYGALRGRRVLPPTRVLWALTLAGLFGQIGGNVLFQWALGIVGLGLAVPLCMGMIIVSSALLARIYLNEAATPLAVFSMALLVAAIWILSLGAGDAYRSVASDAPRLGLIAAGVTGACVSGFAYSVLGVVIRYGVSGRASIAATTFTVTFVGILVLGVWSVASVGLPGLCATHPNEWAIMLSAGVFNLVAFLALAKALQLTSLVYVNGLNASQVAMAAVAGVLMFGESLSVAMVVGVMLTAIGLLLMPR